MSPPLIADRFVVNGTSWIDLATGHAVRLRVIAAGARVAQYLWSDMCGAYARLRHPLLNPLIDYGALDSARAFEAYASLSPARLPRAAASRHLVNAMRFLQSHGVALSADQAVFARRATTEGPPYHGRALGIVIQDRPSRVAAIEVLDAAGPGGSDLIVVAGEAASGLRTLQLEVARAARLRGYVPVRADVIAQHPWLADALVMRHLCVLWDCPGVDAVRDTLARLLARLGHASTRRHVVMAFTREPAAGRNVISIQPMGVRAMASMVFAGTSGPTMARVFEAARGAHGKPGVFLERLGACSFAPPVSRASVAHESALSYGVPAPGAASRPAASQVDGRIAGVLGRAADRADALAGRGRHAAAARLLARASRVLAARGDADQAAKCSMRLGELNLSRGRVAAAVTEFERARSSARDADIIRGATLGLAGAWIEDGRLGEAEALLRSMSVAAAVHQRTDAAVAHALGRCLYWQARYREAAVALQPHVTDVPDVRCLALASAVQLADGAAVESLQLARRAIASAGPATAPVIVAELECACATALAAAGDFLAARQHALAAVAAARRTHRPLDALRARILHLDVVAHPAPAASAAHRIADRLAALARQVTLPRLLHFELQKTLERVLGTPVDAAAAALERQGLRCPREGRAGERSSAITELEAMLAVCHTAADDRTGLDRLCEAARERLRAAAVVIVAGKDRRLSGHSGKPWDGQSQALDRACASGCGAGPQDGAGTARLEAAEPVKFGGEAIGAIACRWIAGTAICPDRCAATLKAAALAAAAPLRAVIDMTPAAPDPAWADLLGQTPEAVALREATLRAARAPYPVLIEGESGSGKELVARAVHRLGPRRDRRFCAINCAAVSDELLEAELFGHTRGAFTGAVAERSGLFEEADGGTLFLDEIGELSARGQAKLLRVVQEGEIRRVGESFARKVDVRIVAATNRRLEQEAAAGRFRTDLRFRLDVIRIGVPALRDRAADIPMLAMHFWKEAAQRVGSRATLSSDALAALARYDWPGNVRELQNAIAWMAVHSPRRGRIGASGLPARIAGAFPASAITFEAAREEFERRFIRSALARANGHRASAAESLGITRQGLAKMMRRLRIDDRPFA